MNKNQKKLKKLLQFFFVFLVLHQKYKKKPYKHKNWLQKWFLMKNFLFTAKYWKFTSKLPNCYSGHLPSMTSLNYVIVGFGDNFSSIQNTERHSTTKLSLKSRPCATSLTRRHFFSGLISVRIANNNNKNDDNNAADSCPGFAIRSRE